LAKEGLESFSNKNGVSIGEWVGLSEFREFVNNCYVIIIINSIYVCVEYIQGPIWYFWQYKWWFLWGPIVLESEAYFAIPNILGD